MSWTLIEADIKCFFCKEGWFRHRGYWTFAVCHACEHPDPFCEWCHGAGSLAQPKEPLPDRDPATGWFKHT